MAYYQPLAWPWDDRAASPGAYSVARIPVSPVVVARTAGTWMLELQGIAAGPSVVGMWNNLQITLFF